MSRLAGLRERLHRRKRNRARKQRRHQGRRARREARAVRRLRHLIRKELRRLSAPRKLYDSTNAAGVPRRARAVAGYINGAWPSFNALKTRFPEARHISISVRSSEDAKMLDVEAGDASPADCPRWFHRHDFSRYGKPIFYCPASWAVDVIAVLTHAGISRESYILLTAHVGQGKHICGPKTCGYPQADGTQWRWTQGYDESVLAPRFWD